ncbi:MAG: hypothetical protein QOK04_2332 [Solirubrobacteraceae bacterium]|jgi:hypothetical protein|nr:hypothetical protein [Solirubrobacteraceae bacterium]
MSTTVAAAGMVPAAAEATTTEIGGSPTEQGKPTCPGSPCLALTVTTGYQASGLRRDPYLVTKPGSLVALTVALGKPNTVAPKPTTKNPKPVSQEAFFETQFGLPSVRLTVLRPRSRRRNNFYFRVKDQSEVFQVKKYFGQTVQFAFKTSIPVAKGDLVALTSPTWAPVIANGLSSATTWRAARGKPCTETSKQTARQKIGQLAQYACEYQTARLTYSALEISTP